MVSSGELPHTNGRTFSVYYVDTYLILYLAYYQFNPHATNSGRRGCSAKGLKKTSQYMVNQALGANKVLGK